MEVITTQAKGYFSGM
jgi:hypothetical protein